MFRPWLSAQETNEENQVGQQPLQRQQQAIAPGADIEKVLDYLENTPEITGLMRGWYTTNQELQQKAAGIWDIVKERPNLHSKYTRMAEMDEIRYQYEIGNHGESTTGSDR